MATAAADVTVGQARPPHGQAHPRSADRPGGRLDDRRRCLQPAERHVARRLAGCDHHRLADHRHRHADAGLRLSGPRRPQARPERRPLRLRQSGLRRLRRFQQRLGILDQRVPGQCRLRGRDLLGPVAFLPVLRRRQQSALDFRRLDLPLADPLARAERRQGGGVHQCRHDHCQAGADLPVHPARHPRLQLRQVHLQPLGLRRCSGPGRPWLGAPPGEEHDAGDVVGVHRYRGCQRVLGPCRPARRCRPCHGHRLPGRPRHLRAGDADRERHSHPAGAGRPQGAVDGGRVRKHRRPLGGRADQHRPGHLGRRRLPVLDSALRRDSLHLRQGRDVPEMVRGRERQRIARQLALGHEWADPVFHSADLLLEERLSVFLLHRLGCDSAALRLLRCLCPEVGAPRRGLRPCRPLAQSGRS